MHQSHFSQTVAAKAVDFFIATTVQVIVDSYLQSLHSHPILVPPQPFDTHETEISESFAYHRGKLPIAATSF